jgi:hypothetical protein
MREERRKAMEKPSLMLIQLFLPLFSLPHISYNLLLYPSPWRISEHLLSLALADYQMSISSPQLIVSSAC